MKSSAWVFLLALATSSSTVLARDILQPNSDGLKQEKPWFCHDLECPRFDLLNKTEEYETRKYQTGTECYVVVMLSYLALSSNP
jgi:hypothetical protein